MVGVYRGKGSKDLMIKDAESQSREFLTAEQYTYTKNNKTYETNQFIHYKDWNEYVVKHQHKNRYAYEIINNECKLYFDIEYYENSITTTPTNLFWYDIIPSLQKHYEAYYGMILDKNDLCISSTEPRPSGETIKWSFHIVVSNGYFFKTNKDIKQFIQYIKHNETNKDIVNAIDISPYGTNQNFKLPYQSKISSPQYTQNIIKGEFEHHLIKRYKHNEVKGYYKCVLKQETIKTYTTTEQQVIKEQTDLDVGEVVLDVNPSNKGSLKDPLKEKLTKLGNGNYDWHTYFAVMCAVKNVYPNIHGKQIFMDWARLSIKFNEETSNREWDGLKPRKNARTLKTIDDLLKKKYPNEYRDENELVNTITEVTTNLADKGYDTKTVQSRYCSDTIDLYDLMGLAPRTDIFEVKQRPYTDIVIKSHLGTGKSTIIKNILRKYAFESILVISPRVMFGNSIYAELSQVDCRLKFYKEIQKEKRTSIKFIVCQLESISTLADKFQLVILDEVESIINQFHSSTMEKNMDKTINHFGAIISNAQYIISADAFITNRAIDVLASMRPKKHKLYIENTFNPYKRTAFYVGNNSDKLTKYILNDIQKNKNDRRVMITGSRLHSDTIHDVVVKTGQTCLKLNRFTDDELATKIRDVNTMWREYQNVVYTSTITVGVSYDTAEDDKQFDKLFINFSVNGACVRDMFQASLRARVVKKNQLYYTVYDRFATLNKDDDDIVLLRTFEELYEWKKTNVKNQLPEWILKIWAYNELERVINRLYFRKVVDKYLHMCGYTQYLLKMDKVQINADIQKHGLFNFDEIDVDYCECEDIYKQICAGEATTLDKIKYLKYDFEVNLLGMNGFDRNDVVDDNTLREMFYNYQQNPTLIHRVCEAFQLHIQNMHNVSHYTDNLFDKNTFIQGLNRTIGVNDPYSNCELKRDGLENVKEYFENHREDMMKLFMFDTHKDIKKTTDKALIGSLNTIYNNFNGMGFKFGERKRKRIDGKVEDITPIVMSPFQKIEKGVVVFDMTGFINVFKKCIVADEKGADERFPKEFMLRKIEGDDI